MIERELLISILKLTKNGPAKQENINLDAKCPSAIASKLLNRMQAEGLVQAIDGFVEADADARLKMAVHAVELGADIQRVSDLLCWQEFEAIAAVALEANGYAVSKNVRFKGAGRRWEIDVVGCRKPRVVCIDCKHYHRGVYFAGLRRMAEEQVERVEAFAEALPSGALHLECGRWDRAEFYPVILTLISGSAKFHEGVPLVPVLQLQDFLTQMPVYSGSLRCVSRVFGHL
jgi:Holliday junction resolvase-like predicted endonuclease